MILNRWRRAALGVLLLTMVVASGFLIGRRLEARAVTAAPRPSAPMLLGSAEPSPSAPSPRTPSPLAPSPPVSGVPALGPTGIPAQSPVPEVKTAPPLQEPGPVPARGSGTFAYAAGRGPVLGTRGTLRRFRVATENGSGVHPAAFGAQVEATLGDRRGWVGGGTLRLQRVSYADPADFTVYLATRDTAGRMCARGGTNIRIGGRPYTSCRVSGRAIINLDRWRLSAKPYLSARVPLAVYRQYVINHEVGHELGHRHQGCPRAGGPAPVMVQQTLTTRGCVPYAWPRRGTGWLTGPRR